MASSTMPITNSRGVADTTDGRIYFSTPSAQVRVPLTGPHLPPTPYYYWGKNFPVAEKLSGGAIIIPSGRRCPKIRKKNPKIVAQCRKYPIPNLYTLNRTIPYLYTLNRLIPYLNTLNRTIPYLNTLSRTIAYLNTLNRTIPYFITLSRTIPYPNTLSRTIAYLKTLSRTIPYLNTLRKNPNLAQHQVLVGNQSESSTKKP